MKKNRCLIDFFRYTSLNVIGMIGLSCYILGDTFFVSKGLGANGLTALNLVIPVYSFMHGSGLMIGMGGGTKYVIQKSNGENKNANKTFTHSLILALILASIFLIAGLFFSGTITSLLGAEDGIIFDMSKTYLKVLMMFSPAFLINNLLICFVRNDNSPALSMTAMLLGSISNVILDWIFIFPCNMGIFGAVIATCLSPIISITILSIHFIKKKNQFHIVKYKLSGKTFSSIISNGIPSLITEVSSGIVIIIFNIIILKLSGNVGVAAYGIIANISLVVIAIYNGIAQGIQPIISKNYGQGNKKNVNSILRYSIITMLIISVIVYLIVLFGASRITDIFNSENDMILKSIAIKGLKLYFIACPFAGFNIILSMYFTSTEKPKPAHIISILRGLIVIIPMTFLLSSLWEMKGVWSSFPVTEFLVSIIGLLFFLNLYKKSSKSTYKNI